jgi:chromosomal replication initiation ATPase DnaA
VKYQQLLLPISLGAPSKASDFLVSECNEYAAEWLNKWPEKVSDNFVCLVGESGSGKTHLSKIWANRVGADIMVSASDIFNKWYELSSTDSAKKYFVLDDADQVDDDILLYYIYNVIKEKDAYILMTAKNTPSRWDITLPDIKSRISTFHVLNIKGPNEIEMKQILGKMLEQRGISAVHEIIEYLSNRIERSYESMLYWVRQIDLTLGPNKRESFQKIKALLRDLE